MQAHSLSNRAARNFPSPDRPPSPAISFADSTGLAHDASNLLGALRLYCDLLEMPDVLSDKHRHYADELRLIADRSTSLLGRLLSLPATSLKSAPAQLDPGRALIALEPVLARIASPDAVLSLDVQPGLPELPFSTEVIERIVLNLVRNSATALCHEPSGHIHIALSVAADRLILIVADNGPGMDPFTAARFLVPDEDRATGRAGLGHRIIYELAHRTGAGLDLRVMPGRGTRFEFTWPLAKTAMSSPSRKTGRTTSGAFRAC